jgi:hypothetical protein
MMVHNPPPQYLKVSSNRSLLLRTRVGIVMAIRTCEGLKALAPVRCTIIPVIIDLLAWARAVRLSVEGTVAVVVAVAVGNVGTVGV